MYAVIKTGGKQYRVKPGDTLRVESLAANEGDSINLEEVLMVVNGADVEMGTPRVSGAKVVAKVVSHGRGKKVKIVKFKRRKHYRRQMGHRQNFTELEITSINGVTAPAGLGKSDAKPAPSKKPAAKPAAKADSDSGSDTTSTAAAAAAGAGAAAASAAAVASLKFLDAPNGEPDDLKKILGIGSVLEEKLNDMGVYHYSQIAEFTDEDIANINTNLNFPGRIERDEWIPQAKDLMAGGEARKLKYLDGPDGEPDDLKQISGVGPVLEGKLNELGIYHFWQVAKFEQKDIDLVNDAMAFPGRIERDEWITQAKNLAEGGEPK